MIVGGLELQLRFSEVPISFLYHCCLGCMCSFACAIIFVVEMMFAVVVVSTKVVSNFIILLVFKFHDHRPDNLGAIDFVSSLSDFVCSLYRSE